MLCDICKKKDAVLFLDHVVQNDRKRVSFCLDCGVKTGIMTPDLKIDLFPGKTIEKLRSQEAGAVPDAGRTEKCGRCGTERSRFLETKKAGCPRCWDLFVVNAREFAKSSARYTGKRKRTPARETRSQDRDEETRRKIELFRHRLSHLTSLERYEEAIKIRDAIQRMEKTAGHAARKI
jgi:protein arginine kinase activator